MLKVVQIKGSNGSGKTTIVKQLLTLDGYGGDPYLYTQSEAIYATVNPNVGWAAVGRYDPQSKMGGCDRIQTVDQIKTALRLTIEWALSRQDLMWGVVFEGMMISTIKTTFYDYLMELRETYEIQPLFVILDASTEGCLKRIEGRGTKRKGLNPDNVAHKCAMVVRHAQTYDPELVRWISVEDIPIRRMVRAFLWAVGDWELLEVWR